MKKFIYFLSLFISNLLRFNPIAPKFEHLEYYSPTGKLQRSVSIDTNLERAERRAQNLEHLEDYDDYEDFSASEAETYEREFYDDLEHYKKRGSSATAAREKALEMLYRRRGNKGRTFAGKRLGVKGSGATLTGSQGGVQATFNINVTRNSFNIPQDLPIEVFNAIDMISDSSVLKKYLPQNVSLSSVLPSATRQDVIYTFVAPGPLIDTITVSCSEVAYYKFLFATLTDMLRVGRTLYKISNELTQTQFNQKFIVVEQGMYGFGKENPLTLSNYINPSDYRKDSLIINTAFDIDGKTGIIVGMTKENIALAANQVSLSISVTAFSIWGKQQLAS